MDDWGAFLTDPEIRKSLSWLGGGLATVVTAVWAVIKYFYPKERNRPPAATSQNTDNSSKVSVEGGSTAIGGNLSINGPTIHHWPSNFSMIALAITAVGIVAWVVAFTGSQIKANSGSVAVGRDVKGSTITIINQEGTEQ